MPTLIIEDSLLSNKSCCIYPITFYHLFTLLASVVYQADGVNHTVRLGIAAFNLLDNWDQICIN